ncbi:YceD family protein [Halalkalibacter urbisdiaboli]|uniref:YceD family protein n=1 Tax=Halalkalibacter urbisdiaboli TaxID=1960589 RepID=UPI000B43582C|nr:DUF177 domain-containing protein [Halalkalibacter urbisdiaboli]
MKWTLAQLNVAKHKPFLIDEIIDLHDIMDQNHEIRDISPVRVKGEAVYTGHVVTFPLHITGELTLPCSRTLADVKLPFDLRVSEQFRPADEYYRKEDEDEDVHIIENDVVDLVPYIKEHILLEIPMQIFAEEDVEPQAPPEGKDWELVTEETQEKKIDPRLADLAKFFDKE